MITYLEPDILECKVRWALGSITVNKASGGGGIPAELSQILKDDAVKVLHSVCQQIWKTQQWPQDHRTRSVLIPVPKKGNAKECSNNCTISLISHANKWQPTPVLLSWVGCSPWGQEESDMTERLHCHLSLSCIGEGNGNPLQCSCLETPRDRGAYLAAVYGVAQSRTRLKQLSSSSSNRHLDRRFTLFASFYHPQSASISLIIPVILIYRILIYNPLNFVVLFLLR